jgi:hypothetical protein
MDMIPPNEGKKKLAAILESHEWWTFPVCTTAVLDVGRAEHQDDYMGLWFRFIGETILFLCGKKAHASPEQLAEFLGQYAREHGIPYHTSESILCAIKEFGDEHGLIALGPHELVATEKFIRNLYDDGYMTDGLPEKGEGPKDGPKEEKGLSDLAARLQKKFDKLLEKHSLGLMEEMEQATRQLKDRDQSELQDPPPGTPPGEGEEEEKFRKSP